MRSCNASRSKGLHPVLEYKRETTRKFDRDQVKENLRNARLCSDSLSDSIHDLSLQNLITPALSVHRKRISTDPSISFMDRGMKIRFQLSQKQQICIAAPRRNLILEPTMLKRRLWVILPTLRQHDEILVVCPSILVKCNRLTGQTLIHSLAFHNMPYCTE